MVSYKFIVLKLLFFSFLALSISAQTHEIDKKLIIYASGGYDFNKVTHNLSNRVSSDYVGQDGFYTSLIVEGKNALDLFDVSSGVEVLSKNYRFERSGEYEGWYTNYNTLYLNVPIRLGIGVLSMIGNYIEGLDFTIHGGPYFGYWLSLYREGQYFSFSGSVEKDPEMVKIEGPYDFEENINKFSRVDYGFEFGSKLSYQLFEGLGAFIECNLLYGTSDNCYDYRNKSSNHYYTTLTAGGGVFYDLSFVPE
ncbi:hypothetical protein [Ichthyobacterium seriolicida]|uniref:Outer membrane protein beta-barrel domain-containing protein n=1 Tax=Ichthyobacterium seriolicida TaxID=242600 RepID=A0A1J1E5Z2_9FLAO|nr:hypothetical protein [Ichthyobacterium seriolicida]BAV95484.1 hypothetical protein JBKA6_1471 [Ichthyobacterium seriolicida]